jgi:fatty acid desaturase
MESHSEVLSDIAELRTHLLNRGGPHIPLLSLSPWRPMLDIAVDYITILGAVAAACLIGTWLAPIVICVIANRQRALGNILHDAGHRNLWRDPLRNDMTARALVAPLLFASLTTYREAHFKHHLSLGDERADPDFLPAMDGSPARWHRSFARNVCSWPAWLGSVGGHLITVQVRLASKLYILLWWIGVIGALLALCGSDFTAAFVILWLLARATVFHLITTFREMCDHFGLRPGGVFTFTRDMACHGLWRQFIHPRNNGYHLTHHLLPAVPYYRLAEAHQLFREMPAYRARGTVCDAYFQGSGAVIRAWQLRSNL